jgi:hypothetical protein
MANHTPQRPGASGLAVTYGAAAAGGDVIQCAGLSGVRLIVKNGSAASINVTLSDVRKCSRGFAHDLIVPVAASAEQVIPVPPYAIDPVTGNANVAYSATASVTIATTAEA